MGSDESTRVEEDFARWEEDCRHEIKCDTNNCENPATHITRVHNNGSQLCGTSFRCIRCLDLIYRQNMMTLRYAGALRCPRCQNTFQDIRIYMYAEKL